jgi:hypothetical protein
MTEKNELYFDGRINTRMKEDKPNKLGMALLSKAVRDNVIS